MKKLLLYIIIGMFMISFTTALEFDNVKNYDEVTKTVTITNAFGFGDDIATVKLNTPLINYVMRGEDRLVAE